MAEPMMPLLLDTHAVLWMMAAPARIGKRARAEMERPDRPLLASVASVWEVAIKRSAGRLDVPDSIWDTATESGIELIGITRADAEAVANLPWHHRDPFDRLLITQAQLRRATFVTVDRQVCAYEVDVLLADQ